MLLRFLAVQDPGGYERKSSLSFKRMLAARAGEHLPDSECVIRTFQCTDTA